MDPLLMQLLMRALSGQESNQSMTDSPGNQGLLGGSNARIGAPIPQPDLLGGPNAGISPLPSGSSRLLGGSNARVGAAPASPMPFDPLGNGMVYRPPTQMPSSKGLLGGPNAKIGATPASRMGLGPIPGYPEIGMSEQPGLARATPPSSPPMFRNVGQSSLPIQPELRATPQASAPSGGGGKELPYQTFERLTGQRWTGGGSEPIMQMLQQFGITARPGSAEANLALQRALQNPELPSQGMSMAPSMGVPDMPMSGRASAPNTLPSQGLDPTQIEMLMRNLR